MDFKLKIKSKKLESGRFQVRFSTEGFRSDYYGYLLTEPSTSVREVVEKIQRHLVKIQDINRYFQPNLFSLGRRQTSSGRVWLFKNDDGQVPVQTQAQYADQ
jgi:hypothetical protein